MTEVLRVFGKWFGGKSKISAEAVRKWDLAVAVLLAGQAAAVLLFSRTYTVPVYVSYLARDSLASQLQQTSVTAAGLREVTQVNIAYLLAAMLLVSAVGYGLIATVWRERYNDWIKRNWQPVRWTLVFVSGSLLLITLALVAGMRQLDELKVIVALMLIASLGGLQLDMQPAGKRISTATWIAGAMTLLAGIVPLGQVLLNMVATNLFGSLTLPGYAWWLLVTVALGWAFFVANTHLQNFRSGKWASYAYSEAWATGIILLIETAVTWQLFAAILRP